MANLDKILGVLPPGRYDSHTHVMQGAPRPEAFAAAFREAGMAGGAVFSQDPNPTGANPPVPPPPPEAMDLCIEWASASRTLYPFYWINPSAPGAVDLVDMAVEKGMFGFKALPGTYYPGDPACLEVFKRIAHFGKPLMFHSGILWDGRFSSRYTRPGNYEAMLDVPGLRFALAHVSWPWCDECIAVFGKFLNALDIWKDQAPEMFIDLTPGTPAIYRRDALVKLFTVGYDVQDHVMFGTDGMTPGYGVDWCQRWQRRDDGIYDELGLSSEMRDSIYRAAFQRFLFGTPGSEDRSRRIPCQNAVS